MAYLIQVTPVPSVAAAGAACSLAATPLAFGTYVPFSAAPTDFTATLSVTCAASGTRPVQISGTIGLLASGGPSDRYLANGRYRMRYQLYLDPARTLPWGDGIGGTATQSISGAVGPGTPFRSRVTVYGRVLARQSNLAVGAYAAHVAVVLNY